MRGWVIWLCISVDSFWIYGIDLGKMKSVNRRNCELGSCISFYFFIMTFIRVREQSDPDFPASRGQVTFSRVIHVIVSPSDMIE